MKKIMSIGIILLLSIITLSGCIEADDTMPTFNIDTYKSNSGDITILEIDEDTNIETLANTIDDLYHNGYECIETLIVNPSWNAHTTMVNYMIFKR